MTLRQAQGNRERRSPALAALVLVLAALALPARAQVDPRWRFRTLDTPHFRVHFHEGLEETARLAAAYAEEAHAALVPVVGHAPAGKTELVLTDDADDANGSATVVPYRAIRLLTVPPDPLSELNDHRGWLRSLVWHEYVHVLHLDGIGGVPAAIDAVFGRILAPNALTPPWLIEGLAVLHEDAPGAGRNDSALFDMYARALVVEPPGLPPLQEISHQVLDWPRGSTWYLLGGRFWRWVLARHGADAVRGFLRDQGGEIFPWRIDLLAERWFGESWSGMWPRFRADLEARYAAQLARVRERPVTRATALTRRGGRVVHPRWSPDGASLAYFDQGLHERPAIRRVGADGADLGAAGAAEGNGTLALVSAGEALVASTDVHGEYRAWDDLWRVDLASGERARFTYGERATQPDVAPGGGWAVWVAQAGAGRQALRRARLDGGAPETLYEAPLGDELATPRVSPEGERIALAVHRAGRWDLALLEHGALRLLTEDDALDLAPAWSPDGRWIYFSTDRTGIFDVHALEVETGAVKRVTNVEMGAFEPAPSPDGKRLAFVGYSRRGFDLFVTEVEPEAWVDAAPSLPRLAEAPSPPRSGGEGWGEGVAIPYSPFPTVLPRWWLPLLGADGAGTTLGAVTGGFDVLARHAWAGTLSYGLASHTPQWDAGYVAGWLWPQVSLATSRVIGTTPGEPERREERLVPASATATFTRTHVDRAQAIAVGWRALRLRALGGAPPVVDEPGVEPYRNGTASELRLSAIFGSSRSYAYSVSPEEGRVVAVALRAANPALGGHFRYVRANASWAEYLRVPGTRHLVLALRGAGGAATGTLGGRQPFSLGGVPATDPVGLALGTFLGGLAPGADVLRGYADGAFAGSSFALANVELRFPLSDVKAGVGLLPAFLRRAHGALFLDAGRAFAARDRGSDADLGGLRRLRAGAGAELRLETVLGYYFRTDLRIGVARGLGPIFAPWRGGRPQEDPLAETQVYVTLGDSF